MGANHACVSVGGDTQRMRRTSFASRLLPVSPCQLEWRLNTPCDGVAALLNLPLLRHHCPSEQNGSAALAHIELDDWILLQRVECLLGSLPSSTSRRVW